LGNSSRWVRELVAARDFPDPAFAVSRGLIPIWSFDDVEAWESRNDPTLKHNRRLAAQQPASPPLLLSAESLKASSFPFWHDNKFAQKSARVSFQRN
jgi:hypothetical protein